MPLLLQSPPIGICGDPNRCAIDLILSLGFLDTRSLLRTERTSQNLYSQCLTVWRAACVELGITFAEHVSAADLRRVHHIASHLGGDAWTLEEGSTKRFIERGALAMESPCSGCGQGMRVSFGAWPEEVKQLEWLFEQLQKRPLESECLTGAFELHFEASENGIKMSPQTKTGASLDLEGTAEMSFYWEDQCLTCCVGVSLMPVHTIALTPQNIDFCARQHFALFPLDQECPPGGLDIPDSNTKGTWDECETDASGRLEIDGTMLSILRSLLSGRPVRAFLMYRGLSDNDNFFQSSEA